MGCCFVDEGACLNYNYKKFNCRKCRDACPNGCWDAGGQLVPELCDRCGLCQAACPVDAVGVEGISSFEWAGATANMGRECTFSCRKQGTGPWACLGFLSSRDLVALALAGDAGAGRDILIRDGDCQSCKPSVAEHLDREIASAAAFLAEIGRGRVLHGASVSKQAAAGNKLDRRSFFSSLFNTGVQTARNVIWPEDANALLKKADWRARMLPGLAVSHGAQSIFSGFFGCGKLHCLRLVRPHMPDPGDDSREAGGGAGAGTSSACLHGLRLVSGALPRNSHNPAGEGTGLLHPADQSAVSALQ